MHLPVSILDHGREAGAQMIQPTRAHRRLHGQRIGAGTIDWPRIGADLVAARYEGPMMLELNGPDTARDLAAWLREVRADLAAVEP